MHRISPDTATVFEAGSSLGFPCYDDRRHTMVNPTEIRLIDTLATVIQYEPTPRADRGVNGTLGEGLGPERHTSQMRDERSTIKNFPSVGVVTPHNARRAVLDAVLPDTVTANTVEKYQGGQRDIIAVSATVSDPQFARNEEQFIPDPRRLRVAISRSKSLTIVVCSTALFEVTPEDSKRLDDGPVWARVFTRRCRSFRRRTAGPPR